MYLTTELVTGGELLEAVIRRGAYSEAEARRCFVHLLKGIQYLHSRYERQHRMLHAAGAEHINRQFRLRDGAPIIS